MRFSLLRKTHDNDGTFSHYCNACDKKVRKDGNPLEMTCHDCNEIISSKGKGTKNRQKLIAKNGNKPGTYYLFCKKCSDRIKEKEFVNRCTECGKLIMERVEYIPSIEINGGYVQSCPSCYKKKLKKRGKIKLSCYYCSNVIKTRDKAGTTVPDHPDVYFFKCWTCLFNDLENFYTMKSKKEVKAYLFKYKKMFTFLMNEEMIRGTVDRKTMLTCNGQLLLAENSKKERFLIDGKLERVIRVAVKGSTGNRSSL
jgi:uncharacterized C2H2 Zn-finger protein